MRIFSLRSTAFALLALLTTFILVACQPIQPVAETETSTPALAEYADEQGFFTASYPEGWISDSDVFEGMPFPNAGFATSHEIIELSTAEQLLPEEEIAVVLMLMPAAFLAELGVAHDAPLDEVLSSIVIGMSEGEEVDMVEELMASATVDQYTLANGAPAARAIMDGVTESYNVTLADLGDDMYLTSFQIIAVGTRNAELEAQVDAILDSFELTASSEDVMNFAMQKMGAMEDEMGAAAPTVTVTASEYAYAAPESVPGGLTRIELANEGEQVHSFYLVKLEENKTVDDFMEVFAALESDPTLPEWLVFYGGVETAPGQSAAYTIDLAPGDYAYFSFSSPEGEEVPDIAKGMLGTMTVTERVDTGAVPPQADVRIELVDFSFVFDGELQSGPQIVEMANSGTETHETILMKLENDAGIQDVVGFLSGEATDGPPPFAPYATAAPIAPGMTAWYEADLAPGEYGLICFIPSAANGGAPHFMLGMTRQLTVP